MDNEELRNITDGLYALRDAFCRPGVPWTDPKGGVVGDVTESIISVSTSLSRIASSLENLAEAVRDHGQ